MVRLRSPQVLDSGKQRELNRFYGQYDDHPFKSILAEVAIEGEGMIKSVMLNQSKAGAIDKAEVLVMVPHKDRLGGLFNCFADTKYFDAGPIEMLHEFDGRWMIDLGANQSVGLGEDKIGCEKLRLRLDQLGINRFCSGMITVIFVSQGKKCARIQESFQDPMLDG